MIAPPSGAVGDSGRPVCFSSLSRQRCQCEGSTRQEADFFWRKSEAKPEDGKAVGSAGYTIFSMRRI